MRPLYAIIALGLIAATSGTVAAQSGQPVDADTFRAQQDPGGSTIIGPEDDKLHDLLKQTIGNPAVPAATGAPAPSTTESSVDDPSTPASVWMVGMGQTSCTDWLKAPGWGQEWMSGFWTGMNTLNGANHNVGRQAGVDTVIADLKKRCTDHPTETIYVAASEVYVADMKGGR